MQGLTIGKLAESAGINLETIRYYERIGLMPAPKRTGGGHRSYEAEHVRRLGFIRRARDLGFTLEDVRALLMLAEPGRTVCRETRKIAAAHLETVRAKLADLQRMETMLSDAVSRCRNDGSPECSIIEMLEAS
jgi:MerR family mercuric resistance operon transcriptional regulator